MIEINTERLKLVPLNAGNLKLFSEDIKELERRLGLEESNIVFDEEFQYAMGVRLKKVLNDEKNYMWYTHWPMIIKEKNCIIGGIMIKGCPNEDGEVIIGYIVEHEYRNKGYMTEAIKGLAEWIFQNPKALCIIGDTEKNNIPSHRVLQKAGAVRYKESEDMIWWKIVGK